ncbi:hypothetical protein FNV43_RR21439 [Rhamnella rubrinervis]|uniref:Neprosin PEP catalytic domain-containing protein n=1 Tax=Rhamnella rubrinervis TaxID=2594499 RepID=A0A8K0E3C0_9ROSA|nr:hypothetical protein FNV43_RR21439 [Rhamnella rubrinervis]
MALCVVVVLSICLLCFCGVQAISKQSDHTNLNEPNLISVLPSTQDDDFDCVDIYKQPALSHPLLKNHKIQFATINTTKSTTFHGAQATIAINGPPVSSDQYSMAQVWVQSGPLNVIQAGWAVDGFKSTGCYNAQCPGFVQVHPIYRPGQPFQNISIPRGTQYVFDVVISQEPINGNWWLVERNNLSIGYWPKELFNHLGDGAEVVRYGGTSASKTGLSPQMGTGSLPNRDYRTGVGYFIQNKIMGSDFVMNDILLTEMVKNVDTSTACYDLGYYGFVASDVRETFSYGGPGGSCGT